MSADKDDSRLRQWRTSKRLSLDEVCDQIAAETGDERPSAAKLSRIERDQDVPPELVPALEKITGIPAKDLRPDLARLFLKEKAS